MAEGEKSFALDSKTEREEKRDGLISYQKKTFQFKAVF